MKEVSRIIRIYKRHYRDNNQMTIYIDWSDKSRMECAAEQACANPHMRALIARAQRQGLTLEQEVW